MAKDPVSRIEKLLRKQQPNIAAAFVSMVKAIKDSQTLTAIEDLIRFGQVEQAFVVALRAGTKLGAAYVDSFIDSAKDTAKFLNRTVGELVISFDQTNEFAVQALRESQLRLVGGFTRQQREATRTALTEGIEAGLNPRQQARAFRDSIGLTSRQVKAVSNFRTALENRSASALRRELRDRRFDPTIRRAIETKEPLTPKQIDRMVKRYRERMIKHRSEVIARTEALRSVHEGSEAMYRQAIEAGDLDPAELVRVWNTARDGKVRDSHSSMHRQKRAFDEPFVSGNGNQLRFPGDASAPPSETVQCRCALGTTINLGVDEAEAVVIEG